MARLMARLGDRRRRAVGRVAALLLAVAVAWPVAASPNPASEPAAVQADTAVGGYLAARHASSLYDFGAAADLLLDALALSPNQPVLLQRAHQALLLDGRVAEAAELATRGAALKVDIPHGDLSVTVDALVRGDADTAAALAANLSASGINRLLAPLLNAWIQLAADHPEAAPAALVPLSRVQGAEVLYHLHGALLADAAGDDARAESEYAATMAAQPDPPMRVIDLAGNFFERSGRRDEAMAIYRAFLDNRPMSETIQAALARVEAGEPPPPPVVAGATDGAAEALFDVAGAVPDDDTPEAALIIARLGLALKPDFPRMKILTARTLEMLRRYADANALYETIGPDSPFSWEVRIGIAGNLDRLDRFDEAEALLKRLAEERADSADPLIELANLLRRRERYREAVDVYDAAFERLPDESQRLWGLYYARGIALERSGMWPRAEADFLKALDLEPGQPLVLNYLGYSWVEQERHLERALEMIHQAVAARPRDGFITDSLGWAYYKLGDFDQAVEYLERAVLLQPNDPVINDHLGDAYWQVGRKREARFRWQGALGLDPDPDVRAAIEVKLTRGLVVSAPDPEAPVAD